MSTGILHVVATPIGHLKDITLRALETLRSVDVIAAEDTRRTRKLLSHYGIHTPLTSYHDHNKEEKAPVLVARLREGQSVALVCDAGTPVLSDPGHYLVAQALAAGIPVVPVPGPSAVTAALSVCGLPVDAFVFEGFLPNRRSARRRRLEALKAETRALVFFEAPHRLRACLEDMAEILGPRPMALARELTKVHEEVLRGTVREVLEALGPGPVKGEITLIVAGAPEGGKSRDRPALRLLLEAYRQEGLSRRDAVDRAARELGLPRRQVYRAALELPWSGAGR